MSERKKACGIMLALLLAVGLAFSMVMLARAQQTRIEVINPAVDNNNFMFCTNTTIVGDRFNATVWIYDAVFMLYGFQIRLAINDVLLNITRAWLPNFSDFRYVFFALPTFRPLPTFIDGDGDGSREVVKIGDTCVGGESVSFSGRRLAATVEFEILYEPTFQDPTVYDYLNITSLETFLVVKDLGIISPPKVDGYYQYDYIPPPDVAVEGITTSKGGCLPLETLGVGKPIDINVTLMNQGNFTETFTVRVWANETMVAELEVVDLAPGNSMLWELNDIVIGGAKGNIRIKANATILGGETDVEDNTFIYGYVFQTLAGDFDGDCDVDIFDIVRMAVVYGAIIPDPMYNPNSDIDNNGKIDIFDLVEAAGNYGRSW